MDEFKNALPGGDCALGEVLEPGGKFHLLISLSRVDPEARADDDDGDYDEPAAAAAAAAAADVSDHPWPASKGETRHETPNLTAHDPINPPVPDATYAPGSRYGAQVDAFCCHHLDFAQKGRVSVAARDRVFPSVQLAG